MRQEYTEYSVCLPSPFRFAVVRSHRRRRRRRHRRRSLASNEVAALWNRCRRGTRIFDLLAQPLPLCCCRRPRRRRRRHRRRRRRRLCPHRHQPRRQHDFVVVVVGVIIDMVGVGVDVAVSWWSPPAPCSATHAFSRLYRHTLTRPRGQHCVPSRASKAVAASAQVRTCGKNIRSTRPGVPAPPALPSSSSSSSSSFLLAAVVVDVVVLAADVVLILLS